MPAASMESSMAWYLQAQAGNMGMHHCGVVHSIMDWCVHGVCAQTQSQGLHSSSTAGLLECPTSAAADGDRYGCTV